MDQGSLPSAHEIAHELVEQARTNAVRLQALRDFIRGPVDEKPSNPTKQQFHPEGLLGKLETLGGLILEQSAAISYLQTLVGCGRLGPPELGAVTSTSGPRPARFT